jgi:hypothetical protein
LIAKALVVYKKIIEIDPENAEAKERIEKLKAAD